MDHDDTDFLRLPLAPVVVPDPAPRAAQRAQRLRERRLVGLLKRERASQALVVRDAINHIREDGLIRRNLTVQQVGRGRQRGASQLVLVNKAQRQRRKLTSKNILRIAFGDIKGCRNVARYLC